MEKNINDLVEERIVETEAPQEFVAKSQQVNEPAGQDEDRMLSVDEMVLPDSEKKKEEVDPLATLVNARLKQEADRVEAARGFEESNTPNVGSKNDIQIFDDAVKIMTTVRLAEVEKKTINTTEGSTINVVSKTKKERKKLLAMKMKREISDAVASSQIVLPQSGYWAIMEGLTGAEVRQLKSPVGQDEYSRLRNKLETIFKKISVTSAGINKFEDWLENTSFLELEIFEYGIFSATYANVNKYPFPCTNTECILNNQPDNRRKPFEHKCHNEDLLMPPSGETEDRIIGIVNDTNTKEVYYDDSFIKKRKEYVFENGFIKLYTHIPSIADFLDIMSSSSLAIRNKYPEIAGYLPYMNSMLLYDEVDGEYIEYSIDDKDDVECILETLRSLSEKDLNLLEDSIADYQDRFKLEFAITNITCPSCGTGHDRMDIDFNGMLFMMEDILKTKTQS